MIELLGLPGCGKSTFVQTNSFCENLVDPLVEKIYCKSRFTQNINKIYPVLYFIFFYPLFSIKIFKILQKVPFRNKWVALKMYVYLFSFLGIMNKSKSQYADSKLIFDEGIHQILWSILYVSQNSHHYVERLWELLCDYHCTILFFDVDIETIIDRLKKRTGKGGAELQHDIRKDIRIVDKALSDMDFILNLARKSGKPVIYNKNGKLQDYSLMS